MVCSMDCLLRLLDTRRGEDWRSNARLSNARIGTAKDIIMTGAELKKLRKSLGLSLTQASRQVEVSSRTWARWEVADHPPDGAVKLFEIENGIRKPSK